jgi:hypothetical protein
MVKLFYPKDTSIALLEQFDHFLPYSSLIGAAMLSILRKQKRHPKDAGRGPVPREWQGILLGRTLDRSGAAASVTVPGVSLSGPPEILSGAFFASPGKMSIVATIAP